VVATARTIKPSDDSDVFPAEEDDYATVTGGELRWLSWLTQRAIAEVLKRGGRHVVNITTTSPGIIQTPVDPPESYDALGDRLPPALADGPDQRRRGRHLVPGVIALHHQRDPAHRRRSDRPAPQTLSAGVGWPVCPELAVRRPVFGGTTEIMKEIIGLGLEARGPAARGKSMLSGIGGVAEPRSRARSGGVVGRWSEYRSADRCLAVQFAEALSVQSALGGAVSCPARAPGISRARVTGAVPGQLIPLTRGLR
jgi:hypothetical protein